jgi:dTDP-4-amino-4,6-dideoxygalactose transaminase
VTEPPIPISAVVVDDETKRAVLDVLESGQLAQGPVVAQLEAEFAALCRVPHAIAVSSGTAALVAAVEALALEAGDEVLTSPFTFAATLNAILEAGATARFVDIDPIDYTMDPTQLDDAFTERTRVVMPVDLYGQPAAMDRIADLATRHGARVVEDAAQAHGAEMGGRATGSFDIGCFSFYATKNVSTGEGGMITTGDDALAEQLRVLRNQGMRRRYEYVVAGHNYRLTDLQAAVGLPQLRRLAGTTEIRRRNAAALCERLVDVPGIVLPTVQPGRTHVFHQFTIRVTPDFRVSRDDLVDELASRGVGTGIYYPQVVFDHECYRAHPRVVITRVPEAERAASEVLSLPVHPHLSPGDLDRIAEAVRGS